jgi:hypothetical protein
MQAKHIQVLSTGLFHATRPSAHQCRNDKLLRRLFCLLLVCSALTACGSQTSFGTSQARPDITRSYDLVSFTFFAPEDIAVSESQEFYPFADVVWRGDPIGARVPQIAAMFETAAARTGTAMTGNMPVAVDVALVRFHGVTDRTRYSVGGVYNIVFELTVLDARTGAVMEPTRRVAANLDAPGGARAVALEQNGQTQKVRITDFLASVLLTELS